MAAGRVKKVRKSNATYILEIILCLIALTAMVFSMLLLIRYHSLVEANNELTSKVEMYEDPDDPFVRSSVANKISDSLRQDIFDSAYEEGREDALFEVKDAFVGSESLIEALKGMYPDDLILYNDGQYMFFEIDDEIRKNSLDKDQFDTLTNGRIVYLSSDVPTESWIDVSKFQGNIDWEKVSEDGIDGAVIRLGYRGYSKGEIMDDDTFERNIKGAKNNGLKVGVYFLTQAVDTEEAIEEAEYVADKLEAYDITGPVVIDVEPVGGSDGRGNLISKELRTECVIAFLDRIRDAGYEPMIYGALKGYLVMLELDRLEDYPKWFAYYGDTPYWPYEMDMWQYSESGRVKGIDGDVDLNLRFIKED